MTTNGTTNQLGYTRIVGWIQSIIDALLAPVVDDSVERAERLEFATVRATQLFAQALQEHSNLEMDWLWYAANMPSIAERRYCLQRALTINPHSDLARSALAKLSKQARVAGEIVAQSRAADANEPA
ncbi:MAG: hypothetical protein M3R61_05240 [Chloroflexota bacterium]|nr:hypothetical protein [Chloroflexota bacterium]